MDFLSNLHTHTTFSDGISSAEEYVLAALEKGFVSLGFSEHGYTTYDSDCCIAQERIPAYLREIARLKEKYRKELEIYCGFESDCYQPVEKGLLDFSIGSVHYLRNPRDGGYVNIDYQPELFEKAVDFCGGVEAMLRTYYGQVAAMARSYRPDIIGHLDLVEKLNRCNRYFDSRSPWYSRLMEETAQELARTGCIVEVNTGCISRGYREEPMPSGRFLALLRRQEIPVTISSDAHSVEHLDFAFGEATLLIKEAGYPAVKRLQGGSFVDVPL